MRSFSELHPRECYACCPGWKWDSRPATYQYAIRCPQSDEISCGTPGEGGTIEGVHGRDEGGLNANLPCRQLWTLPTILLGIQLLISAWRGAQTRVKGSTGNMSRPASRVSKDEARPCIHCSIFSCFSAVPSGAQGQIIEDRPV